MGVLLIVVTLITSTVISTPRIDSTAIRRFDTLVEQHVHDRARHDPEWATSVGLHTADSLLTDRSAAKMHADSARLANELRRLHAIDTSALDTPRVVDWLLLQSVLQTGEHTTGQQGWQKRPGSYVPFNALYSLITGSVPAPRERMAALTRVWNSGPAPLHSGESRSSPIGRPVSGSVWMSPTLVMSRAISSWSSPASSAPQAETQFDSQWHSGEPWPCSVPTSPGWPTRSHQQHQAIGPWDLRATTGASATRSYSIRARTRWSSSVIAFSVRPKQTLSDWLDLSTHCAVGVS